MRELAEKEKDDRSKRRARKGGDELHKGGEELGRKEKNGDGPMLPNMTREEKQADEGWKDLMRRWKGR